MSQEATLFFSSNFGHIITYIKYYKIFLFRYAYETRLEHNKQNSFWLFKKKQGNIQGFEVVAVRQNASSLG